MSNLMSVMGNLALIFDYIPTRHRPKLAEVPAGTAEFDYMLAAILFDVVKKNALAHKALRQFILHADPELTQRVVADIDHLESLGQDYAALAEATEISMREAIEETYEDHLLLARRLLAWEYGEPDADQA